MPDKPLYQTTLSAKARRGLILNALASSLLAVLSGVQWFSGGSWLQGSIFFIMAPVAIMVIVILMRSKHPLEVFEDRLVLNSVLRTTIPMTNLQGIGTHPKRGTPSLTYRDDGQGHSGEFLIHWKFIREPEEEVIAQIKEALARAST